MGIFIAAIYIMLFLALLVVALVVVGITYTLLCEVIKNAKEIRGEMKKDGKEDL